MDHRLNIKAKTEKLENVGVNLNDFDFSGGTPKV